MKPCDRDVCWHYVPLTNTANVYLDTPNSSCSNDRTNKQLRQVSRCSQRAVQSMRPAIKITRASAALPWERWGLQIYSVLVLTRIKAKECFLSVRCNPTVGWQALHAKCAFTVTAWLSWCNFGAQSRKKVHIQHETGQSVYG